MSNVIKRSSILEDPQVDEYIPSEKEQEVVSRIHDLFITTRDKRNAGFEYFDGRNIIDYINDNVKRWYTGVDEREDMEDWQARVFDPFTRNKVISILGKVSSSIPVAEFHAVGDEDIQRAAILGDLHEYSLYVDDNEELMFHALLEAIVKGTVIGYEGYEEKTKAVRDIEEYDSGDEIQVKEGKLLVRKLYGSIVPLEDFYPSSVGIRKIKDMPYCFWRSIVDFSTFRFSFAQYKKSELVQPFQSWEKDADRPFYFDYISNDVQEGDVEIIRYYSQDDDEFIIIANGIWLNPMKGGNIAPLPFNHKKLPFWSAIYEPLGNWFYGKAMPDKLKAMQDVLNVLHNMMLDQAFLSIFSPVLVGGTDDIDDDFLVPGRRIPVTDVNQYKQMEISTPNNFHQFIMNYTKRVLEESSVDSVQQGVAGTAGDRVTAREINEASQAVASILGLFINFVKWGVRDKSRLRAKNILQFYKKPMIERVLGEGATKAFNKSFNTIKLDDTVLTSGKRGIKIIDIYGSREEMPTTRQIQLEGNILEKNSGKRVEKIAINTNYLRDFEFDVKLIPNPKLEQNKALDRALFIEYGNWALQNFPDFVDRETLFMEGTEKFGYRPDKFILRNNAQDNNTQQNPMQDMGGELGVGANLINSAIGGREGQSQRGRLGLE